MSAPEAIDAAHREIIWALAWLDAIRGPYAAIMLAMLAVASGAAWSIATDSTPPALAWMNGIAAVISAAAALAEARSARELRATVEDHEVRLRVQEAKS